MRNEVKSGESNCSQHQAATVEWMIRQARLELTTQMPWAQEARRDMLALETRLRRHKANAEISGGTPSAESDCSAVTCSACGGEGWLWGRELLDPSEDTYNDDQTQYTCDRCGGSGAVQNGEITCETK